MTERIIIAGFGGQGVLFSGKLLAYAGMLEGYHTIMVPTYGAEMRGGTANCSVILSHDEIASPIVEIPDTIICLNEPSYDRFSKIVDQEEGLTIYNANALSKTGGEREIGILAENLAKEAGDKRIVNMPIVGAYAKIREILKLDTVIRALSGIISEHYKKLLTINEKALNLGYDAVSA